MDLFLVEPLDVPWTFAVPARLDAAGWAAGPAGGPAAETIVDGGYRGIRVDSSEVVRLFANEQGGFRADCPVCGGALAGPFSKTWSRDRDPGVAVPCGACGSSIRCADLRFSPPTAFGRRAVVLIDAGSSRVDLGRVHAVLPGARIVGSRR